MLSLPENSAPISRSRSPKEACDLYLKDVRSWAHACIERYSEQPPTDVHDPLTYTTGWEPYILAFRDEHVIRFLASARDETASRLARTDVWRHGYWRMQEAHHGTEHFEIFLGFMLRVDPENQDTVHQLVDAAEHLGNWNPDVPEWFDYSTGLFRSLFFGADGVRADNNELNMPDHLRCANLLILAYDATRESKYLELAESYSQRWASAICDQHGRFPIGLTRNNAIYALSGPQEETYRSFAGMAGGLDTQLDRAENILASGGIPLFLRLWQETHKEIFLDAVQQLLSILSGVLSDVDAGPVADAIRLYRRITGRQDFDRYVTQTIEKLAPFDIRSIEIELTQTLARRPPGVGKRADMPTWFEDGCPRRHNPILLSLAAEVLDDHPLATRAVDLARAYFNLAVQLLPDGRDHGCAARTISAVARGHGRNNHAGMTTAVLLPTMQRFGLCK